MAERDSRLTEQPPPSPPVLAPQPLPWLTDPTRGQESDNVTDHRRKWPGVLNPSKGD
jgi:hypothetical protein